MRNLTIKIICILLAFIVIVAVVPKEEVYAEVASEVEDETTSENTSEINMEISEDEEYIYLLVSVSGTSDGVMAMQGTLNYDRDVFEVVDTTIQNENWSITAYNDESGMFILEINDDSFYDAEAYIYESEPILEVKLKVKDDVTVEESTIEISELIAVDGNYGTIDLESKSITVEIKSDNNLIIAIMVIVAIIAVILIIIALLKGKRGG